MALTTAIENPCQVLTPPTIAASGQVFLINPPIVFRMPGVQFVNLLTQMINFFLRLLYIFCQKSLTPAKKTDLMHCDDPSPIVAEEFTRPGTEGSGQEGVSFLL